MPMKWINLLGSAAIGEPVPSDVTAEAIASGPAFARGAYPGPG